MATTLGLNEDNGTSSEAEVLSNKINDIIPNVAGEY